MKVLEEAKKLKLESQNQRDQRVEELWKKLDPQGVGELDVKGLQKGLRRIDHPLKNADDMMQEIVKMVDVNHDGKIQYEEFRTFVEAAESQLFLLFKSIDRNHDGQVGREELEAAFRKASLTVPKRRVAGFFDEIDLNHDGFISFEEWRDFLLFMPNTHGSPLAAAMSYYSSIVTVNAEGDSNVSEDTLEGLGMKGLLLQSLFGSILRLAQHPPPLSHPLTTPGFRPATAPLPYSTEREDLPFSSTRNEGRDEEMAASRASYPQAATGSLGPTVAVASGAIRNLTTTKTERRSAGTYRRNDDAAFVIVDDDHADAQLLLAEELSDKKPCLSFSDFTLMDLLPEPGYFAAGAISGGISRTATAPIDRLKVYLLVDNKSKASPVVAAAKAGNPLAAIRQAGTPVVTAFWDLYRNGGVKNFFAGNGLNVIKIMPETAIKFGTYEFIKRTMAILEGHGDPDKMNPYAKFAAGGVAGMTAQAAVYPLDTLKFRLQCETVKGGLTGNALVLQTWRGMKKEGRFRSAYRGMTMGLVGMFPYSAIDMGTFDFLKRSYARHKAQRLGIHEEDAQPGNILTGLMGATSGAFGASVVYPLNVLRTRLQTQGTKMHPPTYTGIGDVFMKTYRNEGIRGMYKGLGMNLLKVAPALSITWVTYENSKKFLGLH